MPDVDISEEIKAKKFKFQSAEQKFGAFNLSEKGKAFVEAKASTYNKTAEKEIDAELLATSMENSFVAAKNFLRPGVSDLQYAVARTNKYLKTGNPKLLTTEQFDISDMEFALARVTIVEAGIKEEDFKAKAEEEMECECECESPEEEESEGKKVCASCGKSIKAKKNC